jgi:hypothetical protein
MERTPVRIGRMDSQRPGLVVDLQAEHLSFSRRLGRALLRGGAFTVGSLLLENLLLLVIPMPQLHLCTLPLSLVLGPLVAALTFRTRVLLGAGALPCPRCQQEVQVPEGLSGWPARFNCPHCAIMIELAAAHPA